MTEQELVEDELDHPLTGVERAADASSHPVQVDDDDEPDDEPDDDEEGDTDD